MILHTRLLSIGVNMGLHINNLPNIGISLNILWLQLPLRHYYLCQYLIFYHITKSNYTWQYTLEEFYSIAALVKLLQVLLDTDILLVLCHLSV